MEKIDEIEKHLSRIAWLLGAIESHSELMLRMKAKELGVEVVWWDPTKGTPPDEGKEHGAPAELTKIYQYLPVRLRGK